jgi:hypothetical protein
MTVHASKLHSEAEGRQPSNSASFLRSSNRSSVVLLKTASAMP